MLEVVCVLVRDRLGVVVELRYKSGVSCRVGVVMGMVTSVLAVVLGVEARLGP
jgi:hypothetical protein